MGDQTVTRLTLPAGSHVKMNNPALENVLLFEEKDGKQQLPCGKPFDSPFPDIMLYHQTGLCKRFFAFPLFMAQ